MPLDTYLLLGGYQRWACTCFFIALICCETTFGTTLQFLLLEVGGKYGLKESQSGLYPVAQGVGQLLGSLIFGRLADVLGRRPVILVSLSATVLGAGLCSMVPADMFDIRWCRRARRAHLMNERSVQKVRLWVAAWPKSALVELGGCGTRQQRSLSCLSRGFCFPPGRNCTAFALLALEGCVQSSSWGASYLRVALQIPKAAR